MLQTDWWKSGLEDKLNPRRRGLMRSVGGCGYWSTLRWSLAWISPTVVALTKWISVVAAIDAVQMCRTRPVLIGGR
jgi:hypothetical protein